MAGRFIDEARVEIIEQHLDDKWGIYQLTDNQPDLHAYNGMLVALYNLGFDVDRNEAGEHTVFGNYAE